MIQLYPENDLGYAKLRKCKKFSGLENIMEMSMQAKFKDREVLEKSRFKNFYMSLSESNFKNIAAFRVECFKLYDKQS